MSRMRVSVAVAVVLAVAVTTWVVVASRDGSVDSAPHQAMRQHGIGRVIIDVPATWGLDQIDNCGSPTMNTVLVGPGPGALCGSTGPVNTSMVAINTTVAPGRDYDEVLVDGVVARRTPTRCSVADPITPSFSICYSDLVFPEDGVRINVRSSVDAAEVDRILSRVHISDEIAGVPDSDYRAEEPNDSTGAAYVRKLTALGLIPKIVTRPWRRDTSLGDLASIDPAPGQVVDAGGTVTVTVGDAPPGPAGDVLMKMTLNEGSTIVQTFFDRDLRDRSYGTQIRLGTTFLPTFTGARSRGARVEVVGKSIALTDRRGGRVLTAVRPGKSILRFVLDDGDSEIYLGRLVIVVQKELPYREP